MNHLKVALLQILPDSRIVMDIPRPLTGLPTDRRTPAPGIH